LESDLHVAATLSNPIDEAGGQPLIRLQFGLRDPENAENNRMYYPVIVRMKPMKGPIIALALAVSCARSNLWAQPSRAELLNQACVTKHQAERIALARVKSGAIKCASLEKANGALIWSVDVTQPGKKDITDVWVDATTAKVTAVNVETPIFEKEEIAEDKVRKWLTHHSAH
jgi:hypothetical protein